MDADLREGERKKKKEEEEMGEKERGRREKEERKNGVKERGGRKKKKWVLGFRVLKPKFITFLIFRKSFVFDCFKIKF